MEDISMCIYTEIPPTYLYIKKHSITGLKYFGKTTESDPYKYLGSGTYWKKHYKKHGKEFIETIWVSDPFTDKELLIEFALKFSEENNIVKSKDWANLIPENGLQGGGNKGIPPSEETRKKLSIANIGKKQTDESNEKRAIASKGRTHSVEARSKCSAANLGKKRSAETKLKIGIASRKRVTSLETRKKISEASKRRKHSVETRAKISEANRKRVVTDETRLKLSNRIFSDEHKQKISEAKKNLPVRTCPYCGKAGKGGNMTRHHFNNCKLKDH
jgi:hypothetical protein